MRLVREGHRNPEELARDLGSTGQIIRNWVKQADLDAGRRQDSLTTAQREEPAGGCTGQDGDPSDGAHG